MTEQALADLRKRMNYPLPKYCTLNEELKIEAIEICVNGLEKYPHNAESAAKLIKETMDSKFSPTWHCFVGEGYAFAVEHEEPSCLYLYHGMTAVLLFKSVPASCV
ncbi:hypothetical protein PCE1_000139 [Barthelona sp. PCE]